MANHLSLFKTNYLFYGGPLLQPLEHVTFLSPFLKFSSMYHCPLSTSWPLPVINIIIITMCRYHVVIWISWLSDYTDQLENTGNAIYCCKWNTKITERQEENISVYKDFRLITVYWAYWKLRNKRKCY